MRFIDRMGGFVFPQAPIADVCRVVIRWRAMAKKRGGNPLGNPGSRTNVLAVGVTDIKPTAEGFIITCRKIEIAPSVAAAKTTEHEPPQD